MTRWEEAPPTRYPRETLRDRDGLRTRSIGPRPQGAWTEPVFFEWELTGQSWTDHHPHTEYVYVLAGHLIVESGGVTEDCHPGDLACVAAGVRGTYRAPVYARMLSVYGPNPTGRQAGPAHLETVQSTITGRAGDS